MSGTRADAIDAKRLWHPRLQSCSTRYTARCWPARPACQLQRALGFTPSPSCSVLPMPRMRTLANDFLHLQIIKVHSPGPGTSKGEAKQSVN